MYHPSSSFYHFLEETQLQSKATGEPFITLLALLTLNDFRPSSNDICRKHEMIARDFFFL